MIDINNTSQYYYDQPTSAFVEIIATDTESRKALILGSNQFLSGKLSDLRVSIGDELFNALSNNDKVFLAEISGSIDFGYAVDLEKISQEIKNDDFF